MAFRKIKNSSIPIKYHQVKRILYQIKQDKYPKNEEFLFNISSITITYDENNSKLKNLPFCFCKKNLINFKNNKEESFIIYSSLFQLKILCKSD